VKAASFALILAAFFSFFGIIHSPLSSAPIAMPGDVLEQLRKEGRYAATVQQTPYHWSAAYALSALVLLALGRLGRPPRPVEGDTRANHEP
jgi:AGZA family xanthine/uracil permease-like MFS transporter